MPRRMGGYDSVNMAMRILKANHRPTYSHSIKSAKIALKISTAITGRLEAELDDIKNAALLHDIGKLFVPRHLLDKEGKLTAQEREELLPHPVWGAQVLDSSADHRIRNLARFVLEHHEAPDGTGYPAQLTLDQIHPVSRIINVADRFAALTENRPYRPALPGERALDLLRTDIGDFFGCDAGRVTDVLADFRAGAAPGKADDAETFLTPALAFFRQSLVLA